MRLKMLWCPGRPVSLQLLTTNVRLGVYNIIAAQRPANCRNLFSTPSCGQDFVDLFYVVRHSSPNLLLSTEDVDICLHAPVESPFLDRIYEISYHVLRQSLSTKSHNISDMHYTWESLTALAAKIAAFWRMHLHCTMEYTIWGLVLLYSIYLYYYSMSTEYAEEYSDAGPVSKYLAGMSLSQLTEWKSARHCGCCEQITGQQDCRATKPM